jgi:hypothetical protein
MASLLATAKDMPHEDINEYLEEVERKTLHRGVIRAINRPQWEGCYQRLQEGIWQRQGFFMNELLKSLFPISYDVKP